MKRQEREKERALKADTDCKGFFIVQFLFICLLIFMTQEQSKIWDSQNMIDLVDYEVLTVSVSACIETCILFKVYCMCMEYSDDISVEYVRLCFLHENSGFIL